MRHVRGDRFRLRERTEARKAGKNPDAPGYEIAIKKKWRRQVDEGAKIILQQKKDALHSETRGAEEYEAAVTGAKRRIHARLDDMHEQTTPVQTVLSDMAGMDADPDLHGGPRPPPPYMASLDAEASPVKLTHQRRTTRAAGPALDISLGHPPRTGVFLLPPLAPGEREYVNRSVMKPFTPTRFSADRSIGLEVQELTPPDEPRWFEGDSEELPDDPDED